MQSAVYLLAFLLVGAAYAAPEQTPSIEDLEMGQFFRSERIVGGEDAPDGSVPWMAALSTGYVVRSFLCGGSVATERHIITAAHCIEAVYRSGILTGGSLSNTLRVHVGSNRWNRGEDRYSLERNFTHPHYLSNLIKNDLGVLVTEEPIVFNARVQPVALNFDYVPEGTAVMVAGWGATRRGGSVPNELKRAFLWTLDGEDCARRVHQFGLENSYNNVPPIEPHIEICTFLSIGEGTCNGDSGSALVLAGTNQQIAAVSWGFPCAVGAPDMFASLSGGEDFIKGALASV